MNKEAAAFLTKTRYDFADLCTIMKLLRAPGGCPWDREQTHRSIRKNLIEETYEVVEAIDNDDSVLLREELGDLMLQVVFHARMAEEEGAFDIGDVCDEICRKLIVRHPHIFSDVTASTSGEVLDNWDKIKRATKKQKSTTESMQSVSRALPSLMRAYKLGEKAAKTGFDFPDAASAADGLREELDELTEAVRRKPYSVVLFDEVEKATRRRSARKPAICCSPPSTSRASSASTPRRRSTARRISSPNAFRRWKRVRSRPARRFRRSRPNSLTSAGKPPRRSKIGRKMKNSLKKQAFSSKKIKFPIEKREIQWYNIKNL